VSETSLRLLAQVGEIPTAPLHELGVANYVARVLRDLGLPLVIDEFGNLIATYHNGDTTPVALVAHLDHPGLEIAAVESPGRARASLLGGVRSTCFDRPVPVRLFGKSGRQAGTIVGCAVDPATRRVSHLDLECSGRLAVGDFGIFDLPGFERTGDLVAMRAADDLAGVAAVLATMTRLVESGAPGVVHAVFTRAEEIGLVGAILVAEGRQLPSETIVISLECSRELPGAEPGLGPVIRVGDRSRAFHPDGEALLLTARDRLSGLPIQRQLMSGGTCEASAFGLMGYRTTGVALPLVNYHNVGPGDVISAEQINANDYLGEVELLVGAVGASVLPATSSAQLRWLQSVELFRPRLQATAAGYRSL
jgi:putative aminopeptidase FrvX